MRTLTWLQQRGPVQTLAWIFIGLFILVIARLVYVPKETPSEIARRQVEEIRKQKETEVEEARRKGINDKGKTIAERLEAECDYWGEIDKYNSDGTVTVRKGIYGTWGRSEAMFLPKSSWEALSSEEKRDLIDYVSRGWPDGRSVSEIIVGQVIPSPRLENSNTITVDTVVWP